jgi:hypothetical protein
MLSVYFMEVLNFFKIMSTDFIEALNLFCIGRSEPRAASLPGRTEEMKTQDGRECVM